MWLCSCKQIKVSKGTQMELSFFVSHLSEHCIYWQHVWVAVGLVAVSYCPSALPLECMFFETVSVAWKSALDFSVLTLPPEKRKIDFIPGTHHPLWLQGLVADNRLIPLIVLCLPQRSRKRIYLITNLC